MADAGDRVIELDVLTIRSERRGERHVITLIGELDLMAEGPLSQELRRVETGDAERIVIDLSQLSFIDSTGIKLMLQAGLRNRESNRLRLVPAPEPVQRVLRLTEVESLLPFDQD